MRGLSPPVSANIEGKTDKFLLSKRALLVTH